LLLRARRTGDIDRLLHDRQAGAQQQRRRSTARGSKCGQWRVVSRRTKLNADWLLLSGYWLCYINSTINPVCYALCNGNFRRTYWRIVTCRWSRISRPHRPHVAVGHRPHRGVGKTISARPVFPRPSRKAKTVTGHYHGVNYPAT